MLHLVAKVAVSLIVAYYVFNDLRTLTPAAAPDGGPRLVAKLGVSLLALGSVLIGVWSIG